MRKYVVVLVVFLVLVSCSSQTYMVRSTVLDFKKYSDEGFVISEGDYSKTYKSIGVVTAVSTTGAIFKNKFQENMWAGKIKHANTPDAVDEAYKRCIELGADALLFLKIEKYEKSVWVSGLAVKLD